MSRWIIHRTLAFRPVLVFAHIALYGFLGYTGSSEVGAESVGAVSSALVPAKFQATTIATGITSPTAMAVAPDGRIFVTQQDGRVRLIKNDVLLTDDFYAVDADDNEEHGLLGIAVDPEFLNNQFVYLYYTARRPTLHNRLVRVVAIGDVAVPGSETILHELPALPVGTKWHMGGALAFGPDGKLYVAVGNHEDSPMFPSVSQALSSPFGKILRFNADGTIPGDNPFLAAPGAYPAIWAIGLRNPFTVAIHRQSGLMFINDVGQNSWEEINLGIPGGNYGWSETEGPASNPRFQSPVYAYPHDSGGCAVTGAAFYTPEVDQFPPEYAGKYLFADFCMGNIRVLDPATYAVQEFASGLSFPVNLTVSPDGSVYYLARNEATGNPTQGDGSVGKVTYVGQALPRITTQPISQTIFLGSPVSFTVTALSALSYQWQRDGRDIPGATNPTYTLTSVSMADNGARFRVIVTNAIGAVLSAEAVLEVTTDHLPEPQIVTPPVNSFYNAGDVLAFSGSASDVEDGNLPASALSWRIDYHHDSHAHPFLPETSGISSGSVTIPPGDDVAADVWYRLWLTARDSQGRSKQVYRDIFPGTSLATLPWVSATSGWGPIEKDMSNGELAAGDGQAITLDGFLYPKGLGVHAPSQIVYDLGGQCSGQFIADVGIDDEVGGGGGSVVFEVWLDGSRAFSSVSVTRQNARVPISLSIAGVRTLLLAVSDGGDDPSYDHADWGGARVTGCVFGTPVVSPPTGRLIPQQQFRVMSVDSQELVGENGAVTNAMDGNQATFWHTAWYQQTSPLPHTLVLDLGAQYQVDGWRYLPRQDGNSNGTIVGYQFYVSLDGSTWGSAVAAGTLAPDTTEKTVRFPAKPGRYVRLVAVSEINGNAWTSAAELNVFGTATPSSTTTTSGLLTPSGTTALVTSPTSTSTTANAGKSTTPKASNTGASTTSPASTATTSQSGTTLVSATALALTPSSPAMTVSQNTRWELTLTSTQTYANPFLDVTVTVEYTKAGASSLHGYGFWDGDATFKLRQAFPEPGTWHYKTTATDPSNSGLHNREGDVQVLPYTGTNALYHHGFLQVSADYRSLVHADSTPFLWLGDTL